MASLRSHISTLLVCYDAGCDLVQLGQHLSSLLQVMLHCTHSLPIKLKRDTKSPWEFVPAAAEPEEQRRLQQCERNSTSQH